jgi:ketose-bisphosphate aldolase
MVVGTGEIFAKAKEGGYAVGAFNVINMETAQAVILGAKEMRSPVIVQITEKTMDYTGGRNIFHMVKNIAEFYAKEIPIAIHLDHGKSFEIIQRAVEIGFTSVMYDGSEKIYADNLAMTKKIVDFCHERDVFVKAELGSVPHLGEIIMSDLEWEKYMTDPEQAIEFVKETGVDALAVAIGNAHGFIRERSEPDYSRLSMIHKNVDLPLVLHGASDWNNGRVEEVIKEGILCFNIDTALRISFLNVLVNSLKILGGASVDIRALFGKSRDAVKDVVKDRIKLFGSDGKA